MIRGGGRGGVVRSRSWMVGSRSRLVGGRSGVVRLSVVGLWLGNVRVGLSLVLHVSDKTIVMVSRVSDNLGAAIGKLNSVLSLDYAVFVLSLSLGKVSAVVISTAVLVSKRLRRLLLLVIGLSRVIGSRCRVVGGRCSVRVDRAVISHSGANNKQANQQLHV